MAVRCPERCENITPSGRTYSMTCREHPTIHTFVLPSFGNSIRSHYCDPHLSTGSKTGLKFELGARTGTTEVGSNGAGGSPDIGLKR